MLTDATADLAFALLLAAARAPAGGGRSRCREGDWLTWEPAGFLGHDVHGATLGIIGMGRIGRAVAQRASGFEMTVIHTGRQDGVALPELLARSDFVSLHCPLTPETRHLIDAAALAAMKPTRDPHQHRPRPDRRPGRPGHGAAARGRSPAPRSTSPIPSRSPPMTRC